MKRKKIVIKGVSMVSDEDAWNRNKRNYNLMDIRLHQPQRHEVAVL